MINEIKSFMFGHIRDLILGMLLLYIALFLTITHPFSTRNVMHEIKSNQIKLDLLTELTSQNITQNLAYYQTRLKPERLEQFEKIKNELEQPIEPPLEKPK